MHAHVRMYLEFIIPITIIPISLIIITIIIISIIIIIVIVAIIVIININIVQHGLLLPADMIASSQGKEKQLRQIF